MDTFVSTVILGLILAGYLLLPFALIVGIWVIVAPETITRISRVLNRWVSVDDGLRSLDIPRQVDRFFYRDPDSSACHFKFNFCRG